MSLKCIINIFSEPCGLSFPFFFFYSVLMNRISLWKSAEIYQSLPLWLIHIVSCLRNLLVTKIINPIVLPFTLRFLIDLFAFGYNFSFFIWTLSSSSIYWEVCSFPSHLTCSAYYIKSLYSWVCFLDCTLFLVILSIPMPIPHDLDYYDFIIYIYISYFLLLSHECPSSSWHLVFPYKF